LRAQFQIENGFLQNKNALNSLKSIMKTYKIHANFQFVLNPKLLHPGKLPPVLVLYFPPINNEATPAWAINKADNIHQRSFTGTGRPSHRDKRTLGNFKIYPLESMDFNFAHRVSFPKVFKKDRHFFMQ
jgi:hypothetical protein